MNELKRMAYLDALGIDGYVSRRQLPGAAATRRLAIRSRPPGATSHPVEELAAVTATATGTTARPGSVLAKPGARARTERQSDPRPRDTRHATNVPRFSLVAIVAGDWLWLEELDGMPLTSEQVQLVQSMAHALLVNRKPGDAGHSLAQPATPQPDITSPGTAPPGAARPGAVRPGAARPEVMQFDWPIHANRQLDQGAEAAQAGVAGFLARRLEQHGSRGLVLLGEAGAARVPVRELGVATVSTASTADILANPALKRQVWRDLLPLIRPR